MPIQTTIEAGEAGEFNSCAFCRSGPAAHKHTGPDGITYLCDDHKAALYDAAKDVVNMPEPAAAAEPVEVLA